MMEALQTLLRQTQEEAEKRQDEKAEARQKTLLQEAEERKQEADEIKALIQEQKQMQEHTTAELGFLRGDVGELRDELNKQVTKISEVQESMTLKIAEVEKSVSSVEAVSYTHLK